MLIMRAARGCGMVLVIALLALSARAQSPPADAGRASEVTIQRMTFAEAKAAALAGGPQQWERLRKLHQRFLGIDLDRETDRTQFGKAYDLVSARRTSFGDYALFGLSHCDYSAQLNGCGGNILGEMQILNSGTDLDGRPTTVLHNGRGDTLIGWVLDATGRTKFPDQFGPELTLDPKLHRTVASDLLFRYGVGLYQGVRCTGNRPGAILNFPGICDNFLSLTPGGISNQITWLGPVKTYRARFALDNQGNWEWKSEIHGIDRKGQIPPG